MLLEESMNCSHARSSAPAAPAISTWTLTARAIRKAFRLFIRFAARVLCITFFGQWESASVQRESWAFLVLPVDASMPFWRRLGVSSYCFERTVPSVSADRYGEISSSTVLVAARVHKPNLASEMQRESTLVLFPLLGLATVLVDLAGRRAPSKRRQSPRSTPDRAPNAARVHGVSVFCSRFSSPTAVKRRLVWLACGLPLRFISPARTIAAVWAFG